MPIYQATKLGQIIPRPAYMSTEKGPYSFNSIDAALVRDNVDANFPTKYTRLGVFSTDHSTGNGGVYLFLLNGDIGLQASWVDYNDALAAGDFDYLATKPAGNPIFVDTAFGNQTETPHLNVVGNELFLTYHNSGNNTSYVGVTQNTCLARSTDGINFTRWSHPTNTNGNLLEYDPSILPGDGHTGYFMWCENLYLNAITNPANANAKWTYIGYSLFGGAGFGYTAMWVSDDALNWQIYNIGKVAAGRVVEGVTDLDPVKLRTIYNPLNFRPIPGSTRIRTIAEVDKEGAFGNDLQRTQLAEIILEDDGQTVVTAITEPLLLPRGAANSYDEGNVAVPHLFTHAGNDYITYHASTDPGHINSIAIASVTEVAGSLTSLSPTRATPTIYDFRELDALPPELSFFNQAGISNIAFTARGLELTVPTGNSVGLLVNDLFDSSTDPIVDFVIQGFYQDDIIAGRSTLGLFADPVTIDNGPRALAILDAGGTGNIRNARLYKKNAAGAGADLTVEGKTLDEIGYRTSYTLDGRESPQAKLTYGIRYIPSLGKFYVLSTLAKTERTEMDMTGFPAGQYQPFYRFQNTSNTNTPSGTITLVIEAVHIGYTETVGNNATPTADAGPDQNVTGSQTITLDGTGSSDPDAGDTLTYLWEGVGNELTITNANAATASVIVPNTTQALTFRLTVTDDGDPNLDDADEVVINVTAATSNQAPIASAGSNQSNIAAGATVTLDSSASVDNDGTITSRAWTQIAGTTVTLSSTSAISPTFTAPTTGSSQTLTFRVTITDDDGATDFDDVNIGVLAEVVPGEPGDVDTLNDSMVEKLKSKGYTGSYNDMWSQFWTDPNSLDCP